MAVVILRLGAVARARKVSSIGKRACLGSSSAKMDFKGFSNVKILVVLNLDPRPIRTSGTIVLAGETRSKGSKVLTQVEVSENLIKDLLMATAISTIEVISRIVGHIGSSTIIIGHIVGTIFVVMVLGLIVPMWPERIGTLKVLSIRKRCPTLWGKEI
jgi:hypothetical protein